MQKKHTSFHSFFYSTDKDAMEKAMEENTLPTIENSKQQLIVRLETKHRGGKAVTIVEGFVGSDADLATLGKILKTKCGTGGSVKDGQIIVQGDNRIKIVALLVKDGYKAKQGN
jgi:translation initiation factor 1